MKPDETKKTMKRLFLATAILLFITAWVATRAPQPARAADNRVPILVELFTSEGCSSCPPADRFLEKLDGQPVVGADLIVLSEHVDYWNHIGWKDPYSSHFFSERQSAYANRFGLDTVYTPQMIVDGATEFTGSDTTRAEKAFAQALAAPKIAVRLLSVSLEPARTLGARVEADALPLSFPQREAEVYLAVALNHAASHVSGGENGGRTLTHVAVVRSLVKVGQIKGDVGFAQDVHLKLDAVQDVHDLRVIAFVQEARQGKVVGATEQLVGQ